MTDVTDYLTLVTSEHADKPKFIAYLSALLQPFVDIQAVNASLSALFDLDTAVGDQLDATGQWIGRSRVISTPLTNVYFSFDTIGLGFDQGVWQGPYDPADGLTTLDDTHYRLLLRAKVAANHWDGTLPGAAAAVTVLQIAPTLAFFEDRQNMSMTLGIAGPLPDAVTLAILIDGYLPLKPVGVHLNLAVTTVSGTPVFGFDAESPYVSGFDVGSWGATKRSAVFASPQALWVTSSWGDGTVWS